MNWVGFCLFVCFRFLKPELFVSRALQFTFNKTGFYREKILIQRHLCKLVEMPSFCPCPQPSAVFEINVLTTGDH